jgi:cytochrome oxidase Cu insertion factor (SCO1/SenC/PrrC family)
MREIKMIKKSFLFVLVVMLVAAGCSAQGAATPTAMMSEATPTSEAMMQSSPTPQGMMENATATPEAMQPASTSTGEAMMENGTTTPQAMPTEVMPSTGGMMEYATATPEAMSPTEETMTGTMTTQSTPAGTMSGSEWLGTPLTDVSTGKSFTLNGFSGKTVLVELLTTQCPACLEQQKSIQAYLAGGVQGLVVISLDIASNGTADNLINHLGMNHFQWTFAEAPADLVSQIGTQFGSQYIDASNTPLFVIDSMGDVHPLALKLTSQADIQNALMSYLPKM